MSKFDDLMATYMEEAEKIGLSVDADLLTKVTKGLGPSIYNTDSAKVSCSDKAELDRVKNNFLIKKMGMADSGELDSAIQKVCETFGSSNRNKYRALFYYMLVKNLGKENQYA
ncbi:DUF2853 family protein [Persicitalea jodogahamensis]|uniref:DUF2853 family protein n=1 Tax=Persicitalea jodogahamensis TaxID=402147 RepID=A0A8J3DBJ5_9BACT|nr:DUF2853 family protein [Persicitalea jodogahamensis]GHB79837.1 hypothetical protein GCM10007390_37500 [Persicitalea jodogahamensis]